MADQKNFFLKFAPYLAGVGNTLVNLDVNNTGGDDIAGGWLLFGADVIEAISNGEDVPTIPDELKLPVTISGIALGVLGTVAAVLTVARFQLSGKPAIALKYIVQGINAIIGGKTVPPAPIALTK